MSSQFIKKQDDAGLIEFFKDFEIILAKSNKSQADKDWSGTIDFQVFSEYLINDIQEIQERLKNSNDEYLYYTCRHIFNIQDWIKLMVEDAGFLMFGSAWESLFDKHFGDKHLLQSIYDACFEKWVSQKDGQQKIGENFYNIFEGKLYYRNRFGQWFEVDRTTAFDLKPNQELIEDNDLIGRLNNEYKETRCDAILRRWKDKRYQGVLPEAFLQFEDKETSPDEYFNHTVAHIKTLLKNPVSIAELERWYGDEITDLEHIVKIAVFVLEIVKKRQKDNSHTIYLLRDCLMFHEAHKAIDILNEKNTSSDQILVGRKLLSHKSGEWGYYAAMLDALYSAHLRYPTDFTDFYNEYARLMDLFVSVNPKFASLIVNLGEYIKKHIRTDKDKIIIFDIGFQGSIALLTKYIVDRHIVLPGSIRKIKTDIEIGVGAEWSKKLFSYRHDSDTFPMLNRIQLMTRSNELYHYKEGSLNSGNLRVVMGSKKAQHKAAIELAVLVMVAQMTQTDE